MADENKRNRPHIFLPEQGNAQDYTARGTGGGDNLGPPPRDREAHADHLTKALTAAIAAGEKLIAERDTSLSGGVPGFYLEFELHKDQIDIIDRLEKRKTKKLSAIELASIRHISEDKIAATVYVPDEQKDYYLSKVDEYRHKDTITGKPANQPLIDAIDTIRLARVQSFFTDNPTIFPNTGELTWWEVWLNQGTRETFNSAASNLNLLLRDYALTFADREVCLVYASVEDISRIASNTDSIAELRLARDTPAFFTTIDGAEQRQWSQELVNRITAPPGEAPAVCLLDTGTTYRHPLIQIGLDAVDQQSYDGSSSPEDRSGHGTQLSGLALHGDLLPLVIGRSSVRLRHRLESVRILPNHAVDQPDLYGAITEQAIYRAEITAPQRRRAICLAITNPANGWNGRPSSWSAALDKLAFGEEEIRRLIVVAAGNIRDRDAPILATDYPARNQVSPIESPAQAWNALTVGAYTDKTTITDPTYQGWPIIAPAGDLSPSSRTSVAWHNDWPLKPDLVMEGGNFAANPVTGAGDLIDDLGLLTTFYRLEERPFSVTGETSGASALAARMAAQIWAEYSDLWPETIRALMVHSAEWTTAMSSGLDKRTLLRRYGFGVPDLRRALRSIDHDVTMIIENTIQPFTGKDSSIETKDMVLHDLPWPKEILESLVAAQVRMRITLSYFIEPAPGERGETKRHSYASHGLRFDVKRWDESKDVFVRRINGATGDRPRNSGGDRGWLLGPRLRHRGSLHADIWEGSAADLSARGAIAVFPVDGWWRKNSSQDRGNSVARYSLIVSLQTPEGVNIYNAIATPVTIET